MAKKNSRAKASRLVSKYLTDMASKEDACIDDGDDARMCTRAEKLAEIIWKNTLRFKVEDVKTGTEVEHLPNLSYMKILLERIEGKVQDVAADKTSKTVADRISETTKTKINDIADKS